MPKLKSNRKSASSPQNVARMTMIIANNWGETWKIVRDRAQATQAMNQHNLMLFSKAYRDSQS